MASGFSRKDVCGVRTTPRCPPAPRRRSTPPRTERAAGTPAGRPRPASAVRKIVAAHILAALDGAASTDAVRRQMSGGTIAGGSSTIDADHRDRTRRENRRADFPASHRVARSRRPRPSSTGTAREGSAERVAMNHRYAWLHFYLSIPATDTPVKSCGFRLQSRKPSRPDWWPVLVGVAFSRAVCGARPAR